MNIRHRKQLHAALETSLRLRLRNREIDHGDRAGDRVVIAVALIILAAWVVTSYIDDRVEQTERLAQTQSR